MKSGQVVYIPDEEFKGPIETKIIQGGRVRLEEKLSETKEFEVWLVYFLDDRYGYSVQRLFYKNNLPQITTLTKERIMAKKVVTKKPVKKTATKKKNEVMPLSRFVANLIVTREHSDEKIASLTQKEYPEYKHTGLRTVAYYRKFLNEGRLEKSGFKKPSKLYEEIKEKSERKVAQKKKD